MRPATRTQEIQLRIAIRLCFEVVWLHSCTLQHHTPLWCHRCKTPSLTQVPRFLTLRNLNTFDVLLNELPCSFWSQRFLFLTKFRLQWLRKALSCRAEFRRSYSADILDFAKGLKCQQADSFSFAKGAGRRFHFNLWLGISASHSV